MNMKKTVLGGLAAAFGVACAAGYSARAERAAKAPAETLLVHVGGTMRPAMEEICGMFEKDTGAKVELSYNDSGAIVTTIQTTGKGDICVVHDPFGGLMEKKGWVDRMATVATLTPVIAVRKGNPKKITTVKDLAQANVKVGLTDAEYSTAGHIVSVIFRKAGIADAMAAKDITRSRDGGSMANAVKLGSLDAAIVWNAVVEARKDSLDAVAIEPVMLPVSGVDAVTTATYGNIDMSSIKVTLIVLKGSKHPDAARKLAEFAASDRGRGVFAKRGFSPAPEPAKP